MLKLKNVLEIWKKSRTFVVGEPGKARGQQDENGDEALDSWLYGNEVQVLIRC